jgi:hypothetical protein
MEPDRQKARGLSSVLGIVALLMFVLIGVALWYGACGEPVSDEQERQIAPPADAPGPDGAPGVGTSPLTE